MLFRRRMVWVPTVWGTLLLLGLAALSVGTLAWFAADLLAVTAPAKGPDGRGARTLAVEGWMEEADLAQAVGVFQRGHYDRVLVTGGPIGSAEDFTGWKNYAVRAAAFLTLKGLPSTVLTAVPSRETLRDRTYANGVAVREWSQNADPPLQAIDVFTSGVHARRSRLLYRMALGDAVEVGVIASAPAEFDTTHWWHTSGGAKATMGETLGLVWTACCFWPSPEVPATAAGTGAGTGTGIGP